MFLERRKTAFYLPLSIPSSSPPPSLSFSSLSHDGFLGNREYMVRSEWPRSWAGSQTRARMVAGVSATADLLTGSRKSLARGSGAAAVIIIRAHNGTGAGPTHLHRVHRDADSLCKVFAESSNYLNSWQLLLSARSPIQAICHTMAPRLLGPCGRTVEITGEEVPQ